MTRGPVGSPRHSADAVAAAAAGQSSAGRWRSSAATARSTTSSRAPGSANRWVASGHDLQVDIGRHPRGGVPVQPQHLAYPRHRRSAGWARCTRGSASPARSGRPPREMTRRTRSGAVRRRDQGGAQHRCWRRIRPTGSDRVSSRCPSQSTRRDDPVGQHRDVEAQLTGPLIQLLLVRGEQVHQQGRVPRPLQRRGHLAVARAVPAAAAAVREERRHRVRGSAAPRSPSTSTRPTGTRTAYTIACSASIPGSFLPLGGAMAPSLPSARTNAS